MKIYSVHLRRHGLDPDRDIELVKEGFSWPAFFLTFLWALWHRLWLAAVVFSLVTAGLNLTFLELQLDPISQGVLSLGLAAAFGYLGNDLRCRKLARQDFVLAGVASGEDSDQALSRYLESEPELARDLKP